jgi:hypothetical protein
LVLVCAIPSRAKTIPDSWETKDINDNQATQLQSKRLVKPGISVEVDLIEIRNIGGVRGSEKPPTPPQVTLHRGTSQKMTLPKTWAFGSAGVGSACDWLLSLSGDGTTLKLDARGCSYSKGFRGALNIVILR